MAAQDQDHLLLYKGPSMNPTFFQDDLLYYSPETPGSYAKGDIIIFQSPTSGDKKLVVHRIIHTHGDSYRTQGDNSSEPDPYEVTPDIVIGKVIQAKRCERIIRIKNGYPGYIQHLSARCRRFLLRACTAPLKEIYYAVSDTGFVQHVTPKQYRGRIVAIRTPDGFDLLVFSGNHLAGWKNAGSADWCIRPPFRMIIARAYLPDSFSPDWEESTAGNQEETD